MHKPIYIRPPRTYQSGATLIVAMVLISVSALIGVSVMQNSGLAEQLVSNDKYRAITFRAGDSAAGVILTDKTVTALSLSSSTDCTESDASIEANIVVSTELCTSGVGIAEGFRIGEGIPGFQMSHFYSSANASIDGVDTTNTVVRGAQHLSLK